MQRNKLFIVIFFYHKTFTMNSLIANYERILEILREISDETLLSYQRRIPKMKDLLPWELRKESTKKTTNHSFACLKSIEKELKHYSLSYVTN